MTKMVLHDMDSAILGGSCLLPFFNVHRKTKVWWLRLAYTHTMRCNSVLTVFLKPGTPP